MSYQAVQAVMQVGQIAFDHYNSVKNFNYQQKQLKQDAYDYGVRSAQLAAQEKFMQSKLQTQAEQTIAASVNKEQAINQAKASYQAKVMTSAAASGTTGNSVSSQVQEAEHTAAIQQQNLNSSLESELNNITQSSLSLAIQTDREIGEFKVREAPPEQKGWGSLLFG